MAFHPFRHFRKHQKVFFAIMLIVCMITFVFSGFGSSGADPFQNALRWIGMARHSGEEVLPLYDKTIHTDDLDKLRMQRQLASEFLTFGSAPFQRDSALNLSLAEIEKKFGGDPRKRPDEDMLNPVREALSTMQMGLIMSVRLPDGRVEAVINSLQKIQTQLSLPAVRENADQVRALDAIATRLALQAWLVDPQRRPNTYYFGDTSRTEDLLDFLIWKHQADKLGISLSPADVCREVNRAWGNADYLKPDGPFDNNEWVRKFFRSSNKIHKNLEAKDLLLALTEEYRVALAKEAIVGSGSGVRFYRGAVDDIHHSPAAVTPDEFLKYFQEQRTTVAVSMLPLAVERFVPKVQTKPTDADLRNLFARYKDDEPSPARRQPGFKEPRRIKIEYFSYRPDGPFAKKLAAKATDLLPLFRLDTPALTAPAGGGIARAVSTAALADLDTVLRNLYEEYRNEEVSQVLKYDKTDDSPSRSRFGQGLDVMDLRGAEVRPAVAYISQVLGAAGTGGTMLTAPSAWLCTYELHERATSTAVASTVLAGVSPSPFVALTLPTRYFHAARSLEAVRGKLVERFENTLARRAMETNVHDARLELDKLLNSRSEKKRDEYLKKAVADHGLENFHAMTAMQTHQEMLDHPDPALKELQTAYEESRDNPFRQDPKRPDFVDAMFHPLDQMPRDRETDPIRSQQFVSLSGDVNWVFWRAEDKPAHVRNFEDVQANVKKAWIFEQARKLARDEARRIRDDLTKQSGTPDDAVKFLREQKQGEVFELRNVAHLVPKLKLVGGKLSPNDFRPYQPDKKDIAYPPPDFVDQLLKLKQKGEALVVADQPVKHFYVAVLMEPPQVPNQREFFEIYNFSGANPLWISMMNARRQMYYQKLMEQLRSEATKKVEGGEYVIPESVRNRGESGSSDSGE